MFLEFTGMRQNQFSQKNYNKSMNYLSGHLPEKLISKEGDISWSPRSPDLQSSLGSLKTLDMGFSLLDLSQLQISTFMECIVL